MPKQKTKRPSHRYAGPYWVTTRDGKPSVRRYVARMVPDTEGNNSSQIENATPGLMDGVASTAADADTDSAPRTRGQGLMALAIAAGIVRPAKIEATATGNVASGSGQGISYPNVGSSNDSTDSMVIDYPSAQGPVIEGHNSDEGILVCADCGGGQFIEKLVRTRAVTTDTDSAATATPPGIKSKGFVAVNSGPPPTDGKFTAANATNFMPVNSGNYTQKAPKATSLTVAAAAPAKAKATISRWKMPKAEADALAEAEGKRRCNKCRVARSLECFVRSSVPYGPIKDTHKMCNKCRLGSMGPPSIRPSLDEFGRQFLGEADEIEDEEEEDDAEEVDGEEEDAVQEVDEMEGVEAMDGAGGEDDYKSETSLEDYNPEDWMD